MMKEATFHLIATGGTIDSDYDCDKCTPVCREKSFLPHYLDKYMGIKAVDYHFSAPLLKDSREVNDDDRALMLQTIERSPASAIVLTHGSFTIFETARYLQAHNDNIADKTLILTGALRPIEGYTYSDGLFNLGAAIMSAKYAPAGIYVGIHGELLSPDARAHWH